MHESTSLPYELLTEIFALACIDGGKTGRSLSLTSRYFSNAAEPFRWKTLAIHNLHEFESFARYVDRASHTLMGGARHMFISCPALGDDGQGNPSDVLHQPRPVFRSVFEAVAPTLETLVFHDDTDPRFAHFHSAVLRAAAEVSAGWPRVTEVTLRARDEHSYLHEVYQLEDVMPKLQRLHLLASNSIHTYAQLLNHMQRTFHVAPQHSITHLRFSEVDERYSERIVGSMRQALATVKEIRIPWNAEENPAEMAEIAVDRLLPLGLKCFLIQPTFLEDRAATEQYLEEISSASHWLKGVLTLLPTADHGLAEVYRDWIDRINGGSGCWKVIEA